MMPFLCDKLVKFVWCLMLMFVIHEDVSQAMCAGDFTLVKFNKTKHQLPAAWIKVPTATSSAFRSINADEALKVQFKAECKQLLVTILERFIERSTLSYKMCRAATDISPEGMVLSKKNSAK